VPEDACAVIKYDLIFMLGSGNSCKPLEGIRFIEFYTQSVG
jgi:hypothetical protein